MKNRLEDRLKSKDSILFASLKNRKSQIKLYLQNYKLNFVEFTDHSFEHVEMVAQNASDLLEQQEINLLNPDELYILLMACYLHDIGMCVPKKNLLEYRKKEEFIEYKQNNPQCKIEDYIREIHHELSYEFILKKWKELKIENEDYANAIALVAKAHRKVNLLDQEEYMNESNVRFLIKPTGSDYVCIPYLACIIRIADEMDVTYLRVPDLLYEDFLPENEKSRIEWTKQKSTYGINKLDNKLIYRARTTDENVYDALFENYEKVLRVVKYCQKVISTLPRTMNRNLKLKVNDVEEKFVAIGFIPKKIGFSFNLTRLFETFFSRGYTINTIH
ncbi:MAG: HD domain-containing protein [Chlorobi bacterium]|nr:HD domain-containing protein [Chlorobiota bacterium]MCI0715310.1 HD domain-containing protein [Chlorobiota bacterium]